RPPPGAASERAALPVPLPDPPLPPSETHPPVPARPSDRSAHRDEAWAQTSLFLRWLWRRAVSSGAFHILTGPGVHLDHHPLTEIQRHFDDGAAFQRGGLRASRRGIPTNARIGLHHFQFDEDRKVHPDGNRIMDQERHRHVFFQKITAATEEPLVKSQL